MQTIKKLFKVSLFEIVLWVGSVTTIFLAFFLFKNSNYLYLITSLIGATALIFQAKGNVLGQGLMLVFNVMYVIIALSYRYYGELFNTLALSTPMSIAVLIGWLKNPYKGNIAEVKIAKLEVTDFIRMVCFGVIVTCISNIVLSRLNTVNLSLGTVSVFTSFTAAYLAFKRSPFYAVAYAANDCIIISLWVLAALENIEYISMVICFCVFLLNDIYGFVNWTRLKRKQKNDA